LVEITQLKIQSVPQQWWTLGFEAFGNPQQVVGILKETLQSALTDSPIRATNQQAYDYPEWLSIYLGRE